MKRTKISRARAAQTAWIATMSGALLLACSSGRPSSLEGTSQDQNPEPGNGSSGNGSSSGGGAADQGGGSSSGANTSSSGGGSGATSSSGSSGGTVGPGPLDAGVIPIGDVAQTVTFTTDVYTVMPGAEVYNCQLFANPFSGNADIVSMHGTMTKGSHHFFLFNLDPLNAIGYSKTLGGCPQAGLEIHPFPYLSQQPDWTVQYPPDSSGAPMGYTFPSGNSFGMDIHFLNAGSTPVQATASMTIQVAKSGIVKTHIGNLFFDNTGISVPTSATMANPSTSTATWNGNPGASSADGSFSIFASWSHMHKWGLELSASTNNQTFYSESNWSEPGMFWHMPGYANSPTAKGVLSPVKMTSNQKLSWSCKYYNNTGSTLTFGESAQTNVMCIYVAQYYPANPTTPDVILPPPMFP